MEVHGQERELAIGQAGRRRLVERLSQGVPRSRAARDWVE